MNTPTTPPKGFRYTQDDSRRLARHFALAGLLNIITKINRNTDAPLRHRNIREEASHLLREITHTKGKWTTLWADELHTIVQSARRAGIITDDSDRAGPRT